MIKPGSDVTQLLNDSPISLMLAPERWLLWSMVYAKQPKAYLEIGSGFGGSAQIVHWAMTMNDRGTLTLIDSEPQIDPLLYLDLQYRTTLIRKDSLVALPELAEQGRKFDFVLIDGDHSDKGTTLDIAAVMPVLMPGAYVLIHDANNADVAVGIMYAVEKINKMAGGRFADCGLISTHIQEGEGEKWAGLHLLVWNGV